MAKEKIRKEPLLRYDPREFLAMSEVYSIIMLIIYTVFATIFLGRITLSYDLILLNITLIISILSIATIDEKLQAGKIFKIFRKLYLIPLIFLIYSQIQQYIPFVNPSDYDNILMKWDVSIFGSIPALTLKKIANPWLTEYLQFSYMLYFFLPLVHALELSYRKKGNEFKSMTDNVLFAFYLSYLLYFFMPAIGPRFFIGDFSKLSSELPGVFLTEFFRNVINQGGGIPLGVHNPQNFVNRDCMPSGHTMVTLVNMVLAFRFRSKLRYVILVFGCSLIFATMYLRYHYVVDVLAGACFAFISLKLEPITANFLKRKLGFSQKLIKSPGYGHTEVEV